MPQGGCTGKGFRPGQTGNAGGRSKGRAEFQRQFLQVVEELKVPFRDAKGKVCKSLPVVEALTRQLVKYALKGEAWANRLFYELAIGKSLDLEVSIPEDRSITDNPLLHVTELLKDSGLSKKEIKVIRLKAIAIQFPGRGFGEDGEEDVE